MAERMSLSSKESKAVRLVAEGRVAFTRYVDVVVGEVDSMSGRLYRVVLTPDTDSSFCQCKANRVGHRRCSHMLAVEILAAIPVREAPAEWEHDLRNSRR